MHYTLYPKGVCSTQIDLDVTDGKIHNLSYTCLLYTSDAADE